MAIDSRTLSIDGSFYFSVNKSLLSIVTIENRKVSDQYNIQQQILLIIVENMFLAEVLKCLICASRSLRLVNSY